MESEAVSLVGELNRRQIRRTFERRFTARRMAEDHVQLYRRLTSKSVLAKKSVAHAALVIHVLRADFNGHSAERFREASLKGSWVVAGLVVATRTRS